MEQKIKQQLGEMLFTILALQFKLEEKEKELGECRRDSLASGSD